MSFSYPLRRHRHIAMLFKFAAVVSIASFASFASLAAAQNASAPANVSTSLIPQNVSSSCSSFLTTLNADITLTNCSAGLRQASAELATLLPNTTTVSPTALNATLSALNSSLSSVCASQSCPDTLVKKYLTQFYSNCTNELMTGNSDILGAYDTLYTLNPLKMAICTKDTTDNMYCLASHAAALFNGASNTSSKLTQSQDNALAQTNHLLGLANSTINSTSTDNYTIPDYPSNSTSSVASIGIAFLGLSPSEPASSLCSNCTKQIMSIYETWENQVAYAPGINQSTLLSGQSLLLGGIKSTCGDSYISSFPDGTNTTVGTGANSSSPVGNSTSDAVSSSVSFLAPAIAFVAVVFTML